MLNRIRVSQRKAILLTFLCTLTGAALAAPQVVLISGDGYEPKPLESGDEIRVNTLVTADNNTIVVLVDGWNVSGGRCQEYVIIRNENYRVPTRTPSNCDETGRGDELGRAMAGRSTKAWVRALSFGDAKADLPPPDNVQRLYNDLNTLSEQVRRQEQTVQPGPQFELSPAVPVAVAGKPAQEADAMRQRELERQQREEAMRQRERAAREAAAREEAGKSGPKADAESMCMRYMQRTVARGGSESVWWDGERSKRLCAGTLVGDQPARCVSTVLRGRMGGEQTSQQERELALALCQGTSNAPKTLGCYRKLLDSDVATKLAIAACSGGG